MTKHSMTFYQSDHRGDARCTVYPNRMVVSSVEGMVRVAAYDHVCAEYLNNRRANKNFVRADCLMLDLDNTHSDNSADWKTLDDVRTAFPNVPFYAVESRNHMKTKQGAAARPKYHLYFPITETTDAKQYKLLKDWAIAVFPWFDNGAADIARFFYGVQNPQAHFFDGTTSLDGFLPWSGTAPPEDGTAVADGELHDGEGKERFSLPDTIPNGERNNTLHRYAFRLHMMGLDPDEVLSLTERANEQRCPEPLEESEVTALVNSACKQVFNRQEWIDRVESIVAFNEAATTTTSNPLPVTCLADLKERTPEWLIEGYIPKKELTVMAGDGGVGKTFVWCAVAAAISSGSKPFLLNNIVPDDVERNPQKVMYFSSEDSNEAVLLPRLKASGAVLQNIVTIDSSHENFQKVKLNSAYLETLIATYKPALVIFDPLQSFLPPRADMSARNQMREAMAKLHVFGERYGATFLIIMHTNKQQKVWGRTRLADSADIWDISRSVLICGEASDRGSTRYLSHEKSSYGKTMQTVLFRIDGNAANFVGYTDKRDQQFVRAANKTDTKSPERDAAEQFILEYLEENGESPVKTIESAAAGNFISTATLRRAKEHLREQQKVTISAKGEGVGKGVNWFISLLHPPA